MRPSYREPPMEEDDFPTKQSPMPAVIVLVLLAVNAFASIGPMFHGLEIEPMDPQWQAMWQTLLVGSIGYWINTTLKSAQKDTTIATLSKGK
jgi:hypothetical protein